MPQKKNPDAWELIRGKTGRITGALVGLAHDAERPAHQLSARFAGRQGSAVRRARSNRDMLAIATGAIAATKFNADRLRAAASNPVLLATEAADYLVHQRTAVPPGARPHRQSPARSRTPGQTVDPAFARRRAEDLAALRARFSSRAPRSKAPLRPRRCPEERRRTRASRLPSCRNASILCNELRSRNHEQQNAKRESQISNRSRIADEHPAVRSNLQTAKTFANASRRIGGSLPAVRS